jgi:hypothetical protein
VVDDLAIVVLRFPCFPEAQLEPDLLCSLPREPNASECEDMSDTLPFCEPESFGFFFARVLLSTFIVGARMELKVAATSATSCIG